VKEEVFFWFLFLPFKYSVARRRRRRREKVIVVLRVFLGRKFLAAQVQFLRGLQPTSIAAYSHAKHGD
jgi:hypothetical protein